MRRLRSFCDLDSQARQSRRAAIAQPALNFPFYLVIHRDIKRVRRVRAFLDFMTAEIKTVRQVLSGSATVG